MKTRQYTVLYFLIISMLGFACGSAKKLYEQGDYYQAVLKSADKLRKNPDHSKTKAALREAYPMAVNDLLDQVRRAEVSNPMFANTESVYIFEKLNRMYDEIKRSPGALKVIPNPTSYYQQLAQSKLAAAEEQYAEGIKELNVGRRANAKIAYAYFQMANKFEPNYKDVQDKIEEAYSSAILTVLAQLQPVQSQAYQLSGDFFYDQVKKVFRQIEGNEFIRFYTPEEAQRVNLQRPHHVLTMNFLDFVVGETHTQERIEKVERDSVVVGQVKMDDGSIKKVYNTVSAKLTIRRMEVVSGGILRYHIQDEYSSVSLRKEDLRGEFVWYNQWGSFNGDERALSKEQLAICNGKMIMPPPPQELFVEFTRPIYSQLSSQLTRFYDGY
ncbi:hypothetical protein N6H18_12745 [Reichenbachiella agarivorans]|uniref:Lipoprotein n=1 Tax=Reichenbachiella agarivorans TaxID=2979464 RepID=A0ABY6CL26_9BACT|nr:hypothetical protein [Reichenbachiella agarivorans]UXP31217.1 hypothetical protein N6H18_12745 [Reichenbachiella agarivorans]